MLLRLNRIPMFTMDTHETRPTDFYFEIFFKARTGYKEDSITPARVYEQLNSALNELSDDETARLIQPTQCVHDMLR